MTDVHAINGAVLKEMIVTGTALLERNKTLVDTLNVFPVPDGDTGSNMSMTMNAAVREMKSNGSENVASVAQSAARGALRGARGNSGVILSQIFRGMAKALEGLETFDAQQLADALVCGSDAAYQAVMKPKEGTILTVARAVAESAQRDAQSGVNVYQLIDNMIKSGDMAVSKTPEQLPVLKEAGVVDAGSKGLMYIYRGFKMALDGDSLDDYDEQSEANMEMNTNDEVFMVDSLEEIHFAYCTEFFIEHLNPTVQMSDIESIQEHLQRIGDSVVAVADDEIVKVHVHTNVPGKALQMALRLGELNGVKIENMREQHRRFVEEHKAQEKEYGMVAVSAGDGLDKLFKDLNVDAIVSGGQTMNPSAMDIERGIKRCNARNVFVFPNNKNIVLAAQQAAELINKSSPQRAVVIPTTSVAQGMAGMLAYESDADVQTNVRTMQDAAKLVRSGSVTRAVRTTQIDGHEITQGDYMAMEDSRIISVDKDIEPVLDSLISNMMDNGGEYVTIIYGADTNKEQAEVFAERLCSNFSDADVVLQYGGQPLYDYFIGVE